MCFLWQHEIYLVIFFFPHRFKPLTESRVSESTAYKRGNVIIRVIGVAEEPKYRNSGTGFKHNKDYLDRCTGSTNNMGLKVSFLLK